MFTFQAVTRKRGRDDDSDSDFDDERYYKKSRPVLNEQAGYSTIRYSSPSRLFQGSSLTPSPPRLVTDIEAMTPAQSVHDGGDSPGSFGSSPIHASQSSNIDFSMEMDEDDVEVRSQPPESPAFSSFGNLFMRPAMLKPSLFGSESANTGRIPTPIHPTFKRGGMNGLGYPSSGSAGGMALSNGTVEVPLMQTPLLRNIHRQDMDSDRSRRMPSPISEDEDIPDTPTALTQSQLSRLSFSHTNADSMETEMATPPLAVPPTPRGRKRSGAMTGMPRISMGYREDCEKCRQRVPGHYSHFLP